MKYCLAFLLFILLACQQNQKGTVPEINPDLFINKEIKLSDIADSVIYVSFDTTVIFRGIRHCEYMDSFILISTGDELLKYDNSGNYIQTIGSSGPGPEEYTRCLQFTVDREGKRIFILCNPEVIVYSLDGSFLNRIKLPDNLNPIYIKYQNQSLYCFSLIHTSINQSPYLWGRVDANNGRVITLKPNTDIKFTSDEISIRGNYTCQSADGTLLYWNHFNDTIFHLNDSQESMAYLWSQGSFRLTPAKMTDKTDNSCLKARTILDTPDYLFIEYRQNNEYNLCLYDKSRDLFFRHPAREILNDIDEGIPVSIYDCWSIGKRKYLIFSYLAQEVKEKLSHTTNRKLAEWANGLKEEDNDVLILVRLK